MTIRCKYVVLKNKVSVIHTHLAHVHLVSVFASRGAICGENGGTVAIWVAVDQVDGVVESVGLKDNQHGSENLLCVAPHLRLGKQQAVVKYPSIFNSVCHHQQASWLSAICRAFGQ